MQATNPILARWLARTWKAKSENGHFVHFYDEDAKLLECVSAFLAGGLLQGAACVVIATSDHRIHLSARLRARGFDIDSAVSARQYVALDAATVLGALLVNGKPDSGRFEDIMEPLVAAAELHFPRVLAFGEMVALLVQDGKYGAAIELETLWNQLARRHAFSLCCAYPRNAFSAHDRNVFQSVCAQHSAVVAA